MHHKYAIIDGPRDNASQAGTGTLITGSANWSSSAATRFDENTVFLEGDARLNLQFQREFNLMWDWGRNVEWNESITDEPVMPVADTDISDAEGAESLMTSANFEPYHHSRYGPTFRNIGDSSKVRDALVQLIHQADQSIWIASGHLRSRQIFEALLTKRMHDPDIDIRVYLDGQEYTSQWYHQSELDEHQACLEGATDEDDLTECMNDGYYFGIALANAGIDVRYKYYAYRWYYGYADQMHHKYFIVDGEIVATGSYNLSPNAEFDTFENVVMLHAGQYRPVVASFVDNFERIWETGRDNDMVLYNDLMAMITQTDEDFPIVFTPMALSQGEVAALKDAIYDNCPEVNSDDYRNNPGGHRWCGR